MPALCISLILCIGVIGIKSAIVELLDFLKGGSQLDFIAVLFRPLLDTIAAIPIDVESRPFLVNVFAVAHIEAAVIVLRIIDTVFPGSPIVLC